MNINGGTDNGSYPTIDGDTISNSVLEQKTQNIDLETTTSNITNFLGQLKLNGTDISGGGGGGDVVGPVSAVDGNLVIFDGTTGKIIKDQGVALNSIIDDIDNFQTDIGILNGKTQYQSAGGNVTTFVSQIHSGTVRPLVNNLYDCGIPTSRWRKVWTTDIDTGNVSTSNITANTLTENIAVNKISNVGANVSEIISANKVVNATASILTISNLHQFQGKMTSDRTLAQITDPADITTKAYVDGTTFQTIHDALALPLSNPVEIAYVAPTTNREFLITSTSAEQILKATDTTGVEINNLSITSGNIQLSDIAEPTNALDGQGKLYKKTGNDALFWKSDSTGAEVNVLTGVGEPPTATASQITNFNDYSVLTSAQMLSSLTLAGGGVNKCYGNSVRMTADVDILAGRVVSLSDYATNITGLRVGYLQTSNSNETSPVVYPVGITLNNALAGQKVDICTQGLCTGIMSNATTLNRGSVVACTGNNGLVVAGSTISSDVGVLGSVAMGGAILANQPVLLYLQPWYSVF